ncbi:hypothetical protein BGZ58_009132 [Dissophora ornata]|nr:hypothetical protein BGZ58_009132 [Dissophora ornata]
MTLHTPQHRLHQHQSQSRNQLQQRPDSPTSLEDSQSESGVDVISVDSTDSTDSTDCVERVDIVDMVESLENGSTALASSTVRNPVSLLNLPDAVQTCHDTGCKASHLRPGEMMATPPLSPTRHQFIMELSEKLDPVSPIPLAHVPLEERKTHHAARARARSAPPAAQAVPVAMMSPEIPPPVPRLPAQAASAWTSLLPGVAPIRVNPRPIVRSSTRSSGISTEQRLHQQVPIVLPPEHESRLTMEMSTVNDLGTNTSDVDICILTSWLGLQGVEMLAEVFREHGMENVFCVPGAKVPIVKLWDPELQLSCDMNINTQLGIMNSRMVKTYVAIDHRVRPFAMIIKHWARKRVLNDAANGGTISTYAWICMVINFLQMRSPPILPSLHNMSHDLSPDNQVINGNNTSFFSDLSRLEGFGLANKESLSGLLYAFFRKFAIEFDYDYHVVSVRHGCYLTKESKGWNIPGKHYRLLCVEEPFDTTRNLGNSCDMASSKGLKQEFRRALDILNHSGSLDQVCEQWVFPPCYYHSNCNTYHRVGSNTAYSGNNHATAGRRYGNGFKPRHRHGKSNENDTDNEEHAKCVEPPRHSRAINASANNRYERSTNEKRSRSSSASYSRDKATSFAAARISNISVDAKAGSDGGVLVSIAKETPSIDISTSQAGKVLSSNGATAIAEGITKNRPRKASVHTHEEPSGLSLAVGKQGDKAAMSRNVSSPSSPSRHKSGKGHGGDGSKGHGSQKNGRSNVIHRDGSHGGKAPRAAVELCLADIAKIVNKPDSAQTDSENTGMEGSDWRKKKGAKKSVLWSTNSNRGDSRGGHHGSKQQDCMEQAKARPTVVSTEHDEAGPRIDAVGSMQ